jgi:hypothetical protein
VLLADVALLRRRDEVAVIGVALVASVAGQGHRPIAAGLGLPTDTVRGWLRRFRRDAPAIRALFVGWAFALDPELGPWAVTGTAAGDALEAIGVAVRAWVLRLGPRAAWSLVAVLSGGVLLCHTSCPFPAVG